MILKKLFYARRAVSVARDLIGCVLVRKFADGNIGRFIIVETEAYEGGDDLANHASKGRTKRTEVMFGQPGILYVYLIYGMYDMINIVTGKVGHPAAVLIRALEPINSDAKTTGPGRLAKTLGLTREWNGKPVYAKASGLWIEKPGKGSKLKVLTSARIGVEYAGGSKDNPWRFYAEGNKHVSRLTNKK